MKTITVNPKTNTVNPKTITVNPKFYGQKFSERTIRGIAVALANKGTSSSIKHEDTIINCEHKTHLYNYFGTCWYSCLMQLFFFSDTTSRCAQLNILDIVDILKNNKKLPDKIIPLLKRILRPNLKFFKDESQLKDEYYDFLKKIFLSMNNSLIQMVLCLEIPLCKFRIDVARCPVDITKALLKFFPFLSLNKKTEEVLKEISAVPLKHGYLPDFKNTMGAFPTETNVLIYFLSIFLFESTVTFKIIDKSLLTYPDISLIIERLKKKTNIMGYCIRMILKQDKSISSHVVCVYKCNNMIFQSSNDDIQEIDNNELKLNHLFDIQEITSISELIIDDMTLVQWFNLDSLQRQQQKRPNFQPQQLQRKQPVKFNLQYRDPNPHTRPTPQTEFLRTFRFFINRMFLYLEISKSDAWRILNSELDTISDIDLVGKLEDFMRNLLPIFKTNSYYTNAEEKLKTFKYNLRTPDNQFIYKVETSSKYKLIDVVDASHDDIPELYEDMLFYIFNRGSSPEIALKLNNKLLKVYYMWSKSPDTVQLEKLEEEKKKYENGDISDRVMMFILDNIIKMKNMSNMQNFIKERYDKIMRDTNMLITWIQTVIITERDSKLFKYLKYKEKYLQLKQ